MTRMKIKFQFQIVIMYFNQALIRNKIERERERAEGKESKQLNKMISLFFSLELNPHQNICLHLFMSKFVLSYFILDF